MPGLDGIRALAVLGVMGYHGGLPILAGGFLGVNAFFVLSGFLITSLLVGEWSATSTISLRSFWARRARRLLPAVFVLLAAVVLYARFIAVPGTYPGLRLDSLATLLYVANWHFILGGSSYFAQVAHPSPLEHMWSLAIEEQFYLVWPLVTLGMLYVGRRSGAGRRLVPLLTVAVAGALASATDMALLYHGPNSVMRVYEGTDTRAQDLLVGAILATGLAIWAELRREAPAAAGQGQTRRERHGRNRRLHNRAGFAPVEAWSIASPVARTLLQVVGLAAVVALGVLWSHLPQGNPPAWFYRGGYLAVACGVAVVIAVIVTNQPGPLSRGIGNPVFRYIGRISYGIYLWHFPLFLVLDASRVHLLGLPLLAVRVAGTLAVASASYVLVEQPIRRRVLNLPQWRGWLAGSVSAATVVALTLASTAPAVADTASVSSQGHPAPSRPSGTAGRPLRVEMFGDSTAFTAAFAISMTTRAASYGVAFHGEGILGCGIIESLRYRYKGHTYERIPACNSTAPASQQWPAIWRRAIQAVRPNVAILLAGRWETVDNQLNGQWVHIGEPTFDAALRNAFRQAMTIATSTGALMDVLTPPCVDQGEQPNGAPWPEDAAWRIQRYDQIARDVAATFGGRVAVTEFGNQVCPGGHFSRTLNGVDLRSPDGVHFEMTKAAGTWLADRILPTAARIGRYQLAGLSVTGTPLTGAHRPANGSPGPTG